MQYISFLFCLQKKHLPICQKATIKKRKAFDSSRQRAEGTDIPVVKPLKPRPEPPKKQSNWRRKHEEFIASIRAAKGVNLTIKDGKLPPPPPPSYDPDYIQCPYCQRRFNENAADRHINFCKEQAARIANKGKLAAESKGKLPTRPQYKPPTAKKMTSTGSSPSASSRLPQSDGKTGYEYGDYTSSVNGGSAKGNEGNSPVQLSKFCHECGTRYPVELAKFCCECGVRRMVV
uniref:Zinc finger C2HC domain-containing protein 1A n=1 Tax=Sphenodon punctatus TaxID=8508 RepID=A0A8D0H2Y3_SPHPU